MVTHRLQRVQGAKTGHGVIVPTKGKAVGPDGAVSVLWENGRTVVYYKTADKGRYPLALVRRKAEGGRPHTSAGHGARVEGWTLLLGHNAIAVQGEFERRELERHRSRLMKRFMQVWRNSQASHAPPHLV